MNSIKNKLFAKYGHLCEVTASWEDLVMFQGSPNILTQIKRAWIRFRMASEVNSRCNVFLKSQRAIEAEHRKQMDHLHIIHPFSVFRKHWELLMLVVFTTLFIIIPLDLASMECPIEGHLNYNLFWKWVRTAFDVLCLCDVGVNFFTGYCDTGSQHIVMNPRRIALRYCLTFFIPDLLSSLPTHLEILISYTNQNKIVKTFFQYSAFCKLARFITFYIYSKRLAEAYDLSYAAYRVVLSLLIYVTQFHIFTCLNLAYVGMNLEAVQEARKQNWPAAKYQEDNITITFFTMYARVFFETSHVLLTSAIGFDVQRIQRSDQKIVVAMTWFVSKIVFFFVVSQLISVISSVKASNIKYKEMVRQLREYMRYRQLPENLQKRLVSYYEFRFQKSYFRESEILNSVSGQLRQEIVMHGCRQLVENVEFFKNLPLPLIIRIVSALDPDVYMVNDVIIKVNTIATCMYFIASGCVAVYTKSGQEVCHLEDGNFFGEIALVEYDRLRLASVVAVETCELYKLDKQDFVRAILPYPDLMTKIRRIAHERTEQTEFVEERSAQQRQMIRNLQERL